MKRKPLQASFLRSYSFSPITRFPVKAAQNMARKRPSNKPTINPAMMAKSLRLFDFIAATPMARKPKNTQEPNSNPSGGMGSSSHATKQEQRQIILQFLTSDEAFDGELGLVGGGFERLAGTGTGKCVLE